MWGLNGAADLGSIIVPVDGWHTPDPLSGLSATAGADLWVETWTNLDRRLCLVGMTAQATRFSPTNAQPTAGQTRRVGTGGIARGPSWALTAPSEPGDWVIRARISVAFADDSIGTEETFFRLFVDVPPPAAPAPPRATMCRKAAATDPFRPATFLSVDGGRDHRGMPGTGTWNRTSVDGPEPIPTEVITVRADARLAIRPAGGTCVTSWRIIYAPVPSAPWSNLEPLADLVRQGVDGSYPSTTKAYRANQFPLAQLPPGDWIVRADLEYGSIGGGLSYWRVVVR